MYRNGKSHFEITYALRNREQNCMRMEEECERNVTIQLTVRTTYSVASPLANMVSKTKSSSGLSTPTIFKIEKYAVNWLNFLSAYVTSALLWLWYILNIITKNHMHYQYNCFDSVDILELAGLLRKCYIIVCGPWTSCVCIR